MFEVKESDGTIHITGTEAAQSPCIQLTLKGDRMQELGGYTNIHDAINTATANAHGRRRKVCRHCLGAAKRL
jgi:hypothetical protein